jgi:hypothetical protein
MPVFPDSRAGQDHFFIAVDYQSPDFCNDILSGSTALRASYDGYDAECAVLTTALLYLDEGAGTKSWAVPCSIFAWPVSVEFCGDDIYQSFLIPVAHNQPYSVNPQNIRCGAVRIAAGNYYQGMRVIPVGYPKYITTLAVCDVGYCTGIQDINISSTFRGNNLVTGLDKLAS